MKKLLSFLKYVALLAVSAFLMWYALKELDFTKMWAEFKSASYFWIIISLVMGVIGYISRAYRWKMQFKPAGYEPSLSNTYNSMMVGYVANLVLPRMGEVARCTMLRRAEGIPVNVGFGTVIAERFVDMLMLLLFIGITFLVELDRLHDLLMGLFTDKYNNLEQSLQSLYLMGGITVAVLVIGLVLVLVFLNKLRKNIFFQRAVGFLRGMLDGIFSLSRLENPVAYWLHSFFVWGMYYGMSLVVFYALPATAHLSYGAALSVLVIGSLGMAAPVQGGIGVYHILVQTTLLLYGVPKEAGMAYALLAHTSQTLLVVVMGVLSFMAGMLRRNRQAAETINTEVTTQHEFNR